MSCINCGSERILFVQGHGKDLNFASVPHLGLEHDGYAPYIDGIGGGDDVEMDICLDCGRVQADFPISDETIKEAFEEA